MQRSCASVLCIIALCMAFVCGDDSKAASASLVIEVNSASFNSKVLSQDLVVANFYAPWCPHSRQLEPQLENVAEHFGSRLSFVKIDATSNVALTRKFPIRGYPTLVIFRKGRFYLYDGGVSTFELIERFERLLDTPMKYAATSTDSISMIGTHKLMVYGRFDNLQSPEFEAFKEAALFYVDRILFGYTDKAEACSSFSMTESPSIIIWKKFDEGRTPYEGNFQVDDIITFIKDNMDPLVAEATLDNYRKYISQNKPLAFLFVDNTNRRDKDAAIRATTIVAVERKTEVNFLWMDIGQRYDFARAMGLSGDITPAMVIQTNRPFYRYVKKEDGKMDREGIQAFLDEFFEGKLEPYIRSEEEETSESESLVHSLIGKTYWNFIQDPTKDVIVKLYTPDCRYCAELAPVYEQLANLLKDIPSIKFGQIDVSLNDPVGVSVKGVPTILFYRADQKDDPTEFYGEKTITGFLSFISSHASIPFEAPEIPADNTENGEEVNLDEWIDEQVRGNESPETSEVAHDEL
eukprot:TRINITY_DN2257_c0_g1_i1.p1 TRINITY_DN2257_c0_g1~~TRINITY_DN2257_c0_g1_i1.p1  ORF type:complete len:521 (+),score=122.20 TRINITY_DN2257_c0_g1_i1:64-1626(+)